MITRSRSRLLQANTRSVQTVSSATAEFGTGHLTFTEKRFLLRETERKLTRSRRQVILLNDVIRHITRRYVWARERGDCSLRYRILLRLAVFEGVRNQYYEYARDRADKVAELRRELFDQNALIVDGSDTDDVDSEELA